MGAVEKLSGTRRHGTTTYVFHDFVNMHCARETREFCKKPHELPVLLEKRTIEMTPSLMPSKGDYHDDTMLTPKSMNVVHPDLSLGIPLVVCRLCTSLAVHFDIHVENVSERKSQCSHGPQPLLRKVIHAKR